MSAGGRLFALLLVAPLVGFLAVLPAASAADPLLVTGDADLLAKKSDLGWTGSGSAGDPIVIPAFSIAARAGPGITLQGTRLHVVLEAPIVTAGGALHDGIRILDAQNVTIRHATLEGNRVGIEARNAVNLRIENTSVSSSVTGVRLQDTRGALLVDNRLAVNDRDVALSGSTQNRFRQNNLSTATGQYGFFFEDTLSWRNDIDATNLVNFVPVRWYVGANGTADAPLRIQGIRAELKGITNVAQVMVIDSQHVLLEDVRAKDGVGAGVRLLGVANVTLANLTVEGNAVAGLLGENARDIRVHNSTLRSNAAGARLAHASAARFENVTIEANQGDGVAATSVQNLTLQHVNLFSNAGRGAALVASPNATVAQSGVRLNTGAGLYAESSSALLFEANNLSANRGAGIQLSASQGVVRDNNLQEHASGIRLAQTNASRLQRNNVTIQPGEIGLQFDDPLSYDNDIDSTNVVNGVPVRWYVRAAGTAETPIVLSGFRVELKGITNVAQVMVHKSSRVEVRDVLVANGTQDGLVLDHAEGVELVNVTARNATRDGIHLEDVNVSSLGGSSSEGNGRHGVYAQRSPSLVAENSFLQENMGVGLQLVESNLAALRGLAIQRNGGAGLLVESSPSGPVVIENNVLAENRGGGILLKGASASQVRHNNLTDNGAVGILLQGVPPNATLERNDVVRHDAGIRFSGTTGAHARNNTVAIQDGQFGFVFDDDESYDNDLGPTNLVDETPLHWYTRLEGTNATPILLGGFVSETKGVTNVAQVMLYHSMRVRVENVTALNATHDDILILGGSNITLAGVRANGSAREGISLRGVADPIIEDAHVARNLGEGLRIRDSPGAMLANVTARNNTGAGIRVDASGLRLVDATALGNGGAGVSASGATSAVTLARVNASDNVAAGVTLSGGTLDVARNLSLFGNGGAGLLVSGVEGGNVTDNLAVRNADGFQIQGVGGNFILRNNTAYENRGAGLLLNGVAGARVTGNLLRDQPRQVELVGSAANTFAENVAFIGARQTGYHFADAASYANIIPTNNTVNGVSMQWHFGRFAETIDNVSVELAGITNVAQVMVHQGNNVTLRGVHASNGTGEGILVLESASARIENTTSRANAGDGIHLADARDAIVRDTTVEANGGDGVHVESRSHRTSVERVNATGNGGAGVLLDNVARGAVRNGTMRANGVAGIHLALAGPGTTVEGNTLADQPKGIRIRQTEGASILANNVTIDDGEFGLYFDEDGGFSYNNLIPTSNVVNGIPVRWYTTLTGTEREPVNLSGFRVELKGITNVAQVMVYRSGYVKLSDIVAANGTARGVYLFRSSSVIIENVSSTYNDDGYHLEQTQSSILRDVDARSNAKGVRLSASPGNTLVRVNVAGTTTGIDLDAASSANRVSRIDATGAFGASVRDPSVAGVRGGNLLADAGLDQRVRAGRPMTFPTAATTYRYESERFVSQSWDFGDGVTESVSNASLFRPTHVYETPGLYLVTLTLSTADGVTVQDTAQVLVVPPLSAPEGLHSAIGDRNVTLRWSPPASDGGSPILGYVIYRGAEAEKGVEVGRVGNVTVHYDLNGVENGAVYHYAVAAFNAIEQGPNSTWARAAPGAVPSAPPSLEARAGTGNVSLSWSAPLDDGGLGISGYRILRGLTPDSLSPLADVGNATTYRDETVTNGVTYAYAVAALNNLGAGERSPNATATPTLPPAPPAGVRALAGDRLVMLVWSPSKAMHPSAPILEYRVYRGLSPESMTLLRVVKDATETRDPTVANHRTYHYAVSAVSAVGEGARSLVAEATPEAIDRQAPIVLARTPERGELLSGDPRPPVYVDYLDNTGVVVAKIRFVFDGQDFTARATKSDRSLHWRPDEGIPFGNHTVALTLEDLAGNVVTHEWTFRMLDAAETQPRIAVANLTLQAHQLALGKNVTIQAEIHNVGLVPYEGPVSLKLGGSVAQTQNVSVQPGNVTNVTFDLLPTAAGMLQVSIEDAEAQSLEVIDLHDDVPLGEEGTETEGETEGAPEEGESGIPMPAPALVLTGLGVLALLRRRRG